MGLFSVFENEPHRWTLISCCFAIASLLSLSVSVSFVRWLVLSRVVFSGFLIVSLLALVAYQVSMLLERDVWLIAITTIDSIDIRIHPQVLIAELDTLIVGFLFALPICLAVQCESAFQLRSLGVPVAKTRWVLVLMALLNSLCVLVAFIPLASYAMNSALSVSGIKLQPIRFTIVLVGLTIGLFITQVLGALRLFQSGVTIVVITGAIVILCKLLGQCFYSTSQKRQFVMLLGSMLISGFLASYITVTGWLPENLELLVSYWPLTYVLVYFWLAHSFKAG